MAFGICNQSIVAMRAEPSHKSEMVSQLLFGELFSITERQNEWIKITNNFDDYTGWIVSWQIAELSLFEFEKLKDTNIHCCYDLVGLLDTGTVFPIVLGSNLPHFENEKCTILNKHYLFNGTVKTIETSNHLSSQLIENAYMYLHSPYLWGGRSPFGIDCSGFTQMVYKLSGFKLKRDAYLQAEQGVLIHLADEATQGDLAFFENDENKITHVGLIISKNKIIHSSGRVRIDPFDHYGIYNEDLKKYTHKLRMIKRLV